MAFEHLNRGWQSVRSLALISAAVAFGLSFGCKSKFSSNGPAVPAGSITLSGKVTYVRVPLVTNANGVPTGLETNTANFKDLPARGVLVRAYQAKDETNPDGTKTRVWKTTASGFTDTTGTYSFVVSQGTDTFLETFTVFQSSAVLTRIIADPSGVNSSVPQADRLLYSLRKGVDGSTPAGNSTPGTPATANATVNFDVGITDKLWLSPLNAFQPGVATLESVGTGSRPFAIGDTTATFGTAYIDASTAPAILDLHYHSGVSETRGSFIELDRTKYPLGYNSTGPFHYFGSLRGAASNDDAWDEGVILPLLGRRYLFDQRSSVLFPPAAAFQDLSPDLAIIEGLAPVMAANALKSPYLADTSVAGIQVTDIRDLSTTPLSKQTIYSAPNTMALGWELVLKANGIASPGTATTWTTINAVAMHRFFVLTSPADLTDIPNLYQQLGRLKEAKNSTETIDLAAIFTDTAISTITTPFQITWPRPTTGALSTFVTNWAADPNTTLPPLPFTMSNAVQVAGRYPNVSQGEVAYARFTLTKDTAFNLKIISSIGALPSGSTLQINFPSTGLSYSFSGDPLATPVRIVLGGSLTTPPIYPVQIRLRSPNNLVPDFAVTVQLIAAN